MYFPSIYSSTKESCDPYIEKTKIDNFNLFNGAIQKFLTESEEAAQNILQPSPPYSSTHIDPELSRVTVTGTSPRVSVINYSLGFPCFFWNSCSLFSVNNYNYAPQSSYQRNNDSASVLVGLVGTVLAGVGAYLLGGVLNARSPIMAQVKEIARVKTYIDNEYRNDPFHPHLNAIKAIVDCQEGMFNRIKEQSNRQVALLVCGIVAGSFMAIGALAASYGMMLAGAMLGFATLIGSSFHWSYSANSKPTSSEAKNLLALLDTLKRANMPLPLSIDSQVQKKASLSRNPNYLEKCCSVPPHDDFSHEMQRQRYLQPLMEQKGEHSINPSNTVPVFALQNPQYSRMETI